MKFNIHSYIVLTAIVIGVSCDGNENLNDKTKLSLKGFEARSSKRARRSPFFKIGFGFGITTRPRQQTTNNPWYPFSRSMPISQSRDTIPTTRIPPTESTTQRPVNGCVLPEQSSGSRYEVVDCGVPCDSTRGTKVPVGSILSHSCETGYALRGQDTSVCSVRNTWLTRPICVKMCAALWSESVDVTCQYQGEVVSCLSKMMPGTKATLDCKNFYKLPSISDPVKKKINCREDGKWDHDMFSCDPECGKGLPDGSSLIVNGNTARRGVAPWHVAIYKKHNSRPPEQICGGSLISSKLVISAAHCFYNEHSKTIEAASEFIVAAGKHTRPFNSGEPNCQKSRVESINVKDGYSGNRGYQVKDIAIVRVWNPFDFNAFISPVCIDWENYYERDHLQSGMIGKVVGWGITAQGIPSEELQEIEMPFVSYRECMLAVPDVFKPFVTHDKFCAGYLNGSSVCNGDSGGGLSFVIDGEWYLRGIVSVSPRNGYICDSRYYAALTNVGDFRNWIKNAFTMSAEDEYNI